MGSSLRGRIRGAVGGRAAELLADLVQDHGQAGDGSQEGAEHLGQERILAGQLTERVELVRAENAALDQAALDFDEILVLLGKVVPLSSSSNWL